MVNSNTAIPEELYFIIRDMLQEKTGIYLNPSKISMIQSRLNKRMNALNLKSYEEYIAVLKDKRKSDEITNFINALTTNKTEFFREIEHFDLLKEIIINSTKRKFFIWSAASSTGEEAYSIAMTIEELRLSINRDIDYKILGTDIDTDILSEAESGIYKLENLKNIPPDYVGKYFLQGKGDNSGLYKIKDQIKDNIKFRHHNLINPTEILPLRFDIIFLRNVMIYFQRETIQKVIDKMSYHLHPDALLFIGHSETLNSINHKLKAVSSSVYRKIE